MSTTKVTFTTLNLATGRVTATFEIDDGAGNIVTTSPDFSEEDLRAEATKAGRPDWNMEDVMALGAVALAPPPAEPAEEPKA